MPLYKELFLELVRAGLWETEARLLPNEEIDYSDVLRLAQEQSVVGLVAAGLNHADAVPYETKLKFIGLASQIQQRNEVMNHFIAELVQKMQSAGITSLLVKGQGVAQCYERPLWRTSGDVDFLLDKANYEKAKSFLIPQAVSVGTESCMHLGMTVGQCVVELHGRLYTGLSNKIDRTIQDIQNNVIQEGRIRLWEVMGTEVDLAGIDADIFFVFTHFLKHFYKGGLGLRQICDWCRLLWTYRFELDLQLLEQRIKRMGLMSEWRAFGAFAVEYLGMPVDAMPLYSPDKKWKRKTKRICSFIMEVGNFGQNRDMSYYNTKPYIIRKAISMGQRCGDSLRHFAIFPLDSIRFFPRIMINGLRSAARGE